MKKNYILLFALAFSISVTAQTTTILTGLSQSGSQGESANFALNGNDLYIVQEELNKIVKIDISQSSPVAVDVVTNLNTPIDIEIINGFAYISETYQDDVTTTASIGKIRKFDLSLTNPTLTDVVTNLNVPFSLDAVGNDLYFGELNITNLSTFDRESRISKIDVSVASPTTNTFITNLENDENFEIVVNGNDIYITVLGGTNEGKILKGVVNATNTPADFLTGNLSGPSGLTIKDNELYFSDVNYDLGKIDLAISPVAASEIFTIASTSSFIVDMVFDSSGNLYLLDMGNGEILKVDNSVLSINELSKDVYSIFPNPVNNVLNVNLANNNKMEKLTISNIFGQTVLISKSKNINISELSSGIYILNIETEKGIATKKIIKQ